MTIAHDGKEIERYYGHLDREKFGVPAKGPNIDQFLMRTKTLVELPRHAYRGNKILIKLVPDGLNLNKTYYRHSPWLFRSFLLNRFSLLLGIELVKDI